MRLVVRSVGVWGAPNIRTWQPEDPEVVAEEVMVDIGPKPGKGADTFTIRLCTPTGLNGLEDEDGILAVRPLLVMRRYDFDVFWRWLETIVKACEAETWLACVERLRLHFNWEYDGHKDH